MGIFSCCCPDLQDCFIMAGGMRTVESWFCQFIYYPPDWLSVSIAKDYIEHFYKVSNGELAPPHLDPDNLYDDPPDLTISISGATNDFAVMNGSYGPAEGIVVPKLGCSFKFIWSGTEARNGESFSFSVILSFPEGTIVGFVAKTSGDFRIINVNGDWCDLTFSANPKPPLSGGPGIMTFSA